MSLFTEKALPGKRALITLIVVGSFAVIAVAAIALLIQLDLIGLGPGISPSKESSPFTPPGFVFNVYGGDPKSGDELARPMGISVANGRILVTDGLHGLVRTFDREGKTVGAFSVKKHQGRELSPPALIYPVGIAVGEEGKTYVSDMESSNIMLFDRAGRPAGLFPAGKNDREILRKPVALAAARGLLYVTDIGDQSVKIFNRKGKLVKEFGKRGTGKGEFSFPNGIAVSDAGLIFVADSNNSRIQVFSREGQFKYSFQGNPALSLPRGLAIDGLNRLHVADTLGHKVSVFTLEGKFLLSYGGVEDEEETSERQLYYPNGIAVDKEARRVYVTDKGNNRVSVWEY